MIQWYPRIEEEIQHSTHIGIETDIIPLFINILLYSSASISNNQMYLKNRSKNKLSTTSTEKKVVKPPPINKTNHPPSKITTKSNIPTKSQIPPPSRAKQ